MGRENLGLLFCGNKGKYASLTYGGGYSAQAYKAMNNRTVAMS